MKPPHAWAHAGVALTVVGVDYALVSPWVATNYGVRGMAALILWLLYSRLVPLESDLAVPRWGCLRGSAHWLRRFMLLATAFGLCALLALFITTRSIGWPAAYAPLVIPSLDQASAFLLHGVVAAPIAEEFIYRGVVHPRLERAAGGAWAILLAGPIFWVLHWVDRGGVSPVHHLAAGWILAWAAHATRSLFASTLLHSLGNLLLLGFDLLWFRYPGLFRELLGS